MHMHTHKMKAERERRLRGREKIEETNRSEENTLNKSAAVPLKGKMVILFS